jgi:NitT/TauT family transport system substrate-binding protein
LVTLEDVATWAMARGYAPAQPMPNFLSHLALDALLAVGPERVTVVR